MARRFIRASEIGEYSFCQRAWWLHQVEGVEPDGAGRRAAGVAAHTQHGQRVAASNALLIVGVVLALLATILVLI
jgi:CRISPR/Cas system-associated exonuclease Cas4 (RecB family)